MKFYAALSILVSLMLAACSAQAELIQNRDQFFITNWRFHRGDIENAETTDFDDSSWRIVDLPHDWSIEDIPEKLSNDQIGPFSTKSSGARNTGHVLGGTGWYRKTFTLSPAGSKSVSIHFDGVYMRSTVWVNGHKLGFQPYGYTPFFYDLTPYLNDPGSENVIAVQVENLGKNSRWYSGSGIYRHVWLTVTNPVHIAPWGVYVTTPNVANEQADVSIATNIENDSNADQAATCTVELLQACGNVVAKTSSSIQVPAGGARESQQTLQVDAPELWSIDSPQLYTARVSVYLDDEIVDQTSTPFGIRSIEFSAEKGFLLNGEPVLLKGGNMHHDNGPLGAATFNRAEERRVELMKQNGFNAIRTSHNPPSTAFLNACDRLGMLVVDEAFDQWQIPKNPDDYNRYFDDWHQRDLAAMVLRDRNHPSVIMWSIGNEINERATAKGVEIASRLKRIVKKYDKTRPVTNAICGFWEPQNKGREWTDTIPAFAVLDVHAYNYNWQHYEKDYAAFPDRIICGTESFPLEALENWRMVVKHPYVIGDFVWTCMDYIGEAAIGHALYSAENETVETGWPWFNAFCGDIDLCGFKKPQSFYRDVVWKNSNLEMLVHEPIPVGKTEIVSRWGWPNELPSWTWPGAENEKLQVRVFSNYPQVRILLNGKEIGTQKIELDSTITAIFHVPYTPGELKAVAFQDGKEMESKILATTGEPMGIRLTPDRETINADRNDLSFITVEAIDKKGMRVPNAAIPIQFEITGAGELAAVGNGNPKDMKSFQAPECTTFRGRCLLVVRSSGEKGAVNIIAHAEGLKSSSTTLAAQ